MDNKSKGKGAPRGFRLRSPYDIRRAVARVMNEVYKGDTTPDVAAKIGYLAGVWLKANEQSDLVARIEKLEGKNGQDT